MVSCYAPGCSHKSGGPAGCSFHRFPKNVVKRRLWNRKLRRADRKPTDASRVCKCHFLRGLGQAPALLSAAQRSPQPEVVIRSVFGRVTTRRGVAAGVQAGAESTAVKEDEPSAANNQEPASDHSYGRTVVVGVEEEEDADAAAAVAVLHMPRLKNVKGFHHRCKKPSSPPAVCPADPETPCTSSSSSPPPGYPPLQSASELSQPPSPVVLPIHCKEHPAKKMCTDMYGYIHNVSLIQTNHGNLPYFTATLQQAANYHPVTINSHLHAKISNIQVDRTPVRLRNPTLFESTTKPAELSVLVDSHTDVEVIDSLPFPHQPYPVTLDCGLEKLGAWAQYQVRIRDRASHEEGPQFVKTEDQNMAISPSVGPPAPVFEEVMTTYKGEIIGAFATITQTCPQNHTLFKVNPGLKNTLCAPCEMHYKNAKFSIKCEAIVTVELSDSSKKVWKFANGCFAKVVPPRLWTTKEDVIQHLLDLNMGDFNVRNNEIISCSPCPITSVTTAL